MCACTGRNSFLSKKTQSITPVTSNFRQVPSSVPRLFFSLLREWKKSCQYSTTPKKEFLP
ncbi:hypothetical protein J6590_092434 [Homalodisca vitripennis]|nr:hypothetical protein J6590_092434 [Homalodisca vitripennis]